MPEISQKSVSREAFEREELVTQQPSIDDQRDDVMGGLETTTVNPRIEARPRIEAKVSVYMLGGPYR